VLFSSFEQGTLCPQFGQTGINIIPALTTIKRGFTSFHDTACRLCALSGHRLSPYWYYCTRNGSWDLYRL